MKYGIIVALLCIVRGVSGTAETGDGSIPQIPSLGLVKSIVSSTASQDFADNSRAYEAASAWASEKLHGMADKPAPYLACAEYQNGQVARAGLERALSSASVKLLSNTQAHGTCLVVTASTSDAALLSNALDDFALVSVGPYIPSLKIAPALLQRKYFASGRGSARDARKKFRNPFGKATRDEPPRGLTVLLAPGALALQEGGVAAMFKEWRAGFVSKSVDLWRTSFWSDPDARVDKGGEHPANHAEGLARVQEWSRSAKVVHDLADARGTSPGEVCGWDMGRLHLVDDDVVAIEGLDHLFESSDKKSEDLRAACMMGCISHLAAKPEVLRVSPLHRPKLLNAVAGAVVESATTTDSPLTDAGLDGDGEVIQVVDTGLDHSSCFFADYDGENVEHGYLFEGVRVTEDGNASVAGSPYFTYDMSRRKVVQYIELFKVPDDDGGSSLDDSVMYATEYYDRYMAGDNDEDDQTDDDEADDDYDFYPDDSYCSQVLDNLSYYFEDYYDDDDSTSESTTGTSTTTTTSSFSGGFDQDTYWGHGTWTAGIAAGATDRGSPYLTQTCYGDQIPTCVGECMSTSDASDYLDNTWLNGETFCPAYDCDGYGASSDICLGSDVLETLVENSGVAPGARLAIFDVSYTGDDFYVDLAGNFVWKSTFGTGTKIHSNSWIWTWACEVSDFDTLYDTFMYENPEHLLIFASGNLGGLKDSEYVDGCTTGSPAIAKNILAVGATSNSPSRVPWTGADGRLRYEQVGITDYTPEGYPWICVDPWLGLPSTSDDGADIDTLAFFSSYGPSSDGRIKPEVVAPGDQVFSVVSDGSDEYTCRIGPGIGTSASCPVVAGSAALVRQYFTDSTFYAEDLSMRERCGHRRILGAPNSLSSGNFMHESFAPSAATVKAMLINSANLMGGGTEPDTFRGFGRVHLEAGMPLKGEGDLALLVADASTTSIAAFGEDKYSIHVNADTDVELRITLCWIDPPSQSFASLQLLHDLDLTVTSPSGTVYTMWESGDADTVNVIERVIVPVVTEGGEWDVTVSSGALLTETQAYSLVITGPLSLCVAH